MEPNSIVMICKYWGCYSVQLVPFHWVAVLQSRVLVSLSPPSLSLLSLSTCLWSPRERDTHKGKEGEREKKQPIKIRHQFDVLTSTNSGKSLLKEWSWRLKDQLLTASCLFSSSDDRTLPTVGAVSTCREWEGGRDGRRGREGGRESKLFNLLHHSL